MSKPPPLPAEVLARVLRISGIDGYTLVFIAGGFGLISASCRDWLGAATGALAAGAGLIELHGRRRLRAGDSGGVGWLVRSQWVLLTVILAYVAYQLRYFDAPELLTAVEKNLATFQRRLGIEPTSIAHTFDLTQPQLRELATQTVHLAYIVVGVSSILFQGGLALYYHRATQAIGKALRKT